MEWSQKNGLASSDGVLLKPKCLWLHFRKKQYQYLLFDLRNFRYWIWWISPTAVQLLSLFEGYSLGQVEY